MPGATVYESSVGVHFQTVMRSACVRAASISSVSTVHMSLQPFTAYLLISPLDQHVSDKEWPSVILVTVDDSDISMVHLLVQNYLALQGPP